VKTASADEVGMEAGFAACLLGGSFASSLGLAFGVMRVTLRLMAATTRREFSGPGLSPLR
jgi:hypothetical protein